MQGDEEGKELEDRTERDVEMNDVNARSNVKLMSNEEFWKLFLENNLKFQTEPFRGNNPIFIPMMTDPKEYEDRYIHNQQQVLLKQSRQRDAESDVQEKNKFKKTKNDVNFVRNLGLDDLPSGFGAFKTDKEIDLLTKVEGT